MNQLVRAAQVTLDNPGPTGTLRLSDMDFTDLYVSEVGEGLIRGLGDGDGPMTSVPIDIVEDFHDIYRKVTQMGQVEDEFSLDHDGVRYRVAKIDSQTETWYALRRLMWPIPRLRKFEFPQVVMRELGAIGRDGSTGVQRGRGLILVAGATGNGKTTTTCSILQEFLITFGNVAVTIEDPPELKLEGKHGAHGHCYQLKVKNGDFGAPLRKTMRMNPRYILVGEIRDPDGASQALRAAISGHVVLSTIHSGSIEEAYSSLLKFVAAEFKDDLARNMLADGLSAIIHQELKLIRTSDGRFQRKPSIKCLFVGNDKGIRAKIREGRPEALIQDIEKQQNRIQRNMALFDK